MKINDYIIKIQKLKLRMFSRKVLYLAGFVCPSKPIIQSSQIYLTRCTTRIFHWGRGESDPQAIYTLYLTLKLRYKIMS